MNTAFRYSQKHFLSKEDVLKIKALESRCYEFEHIALKLELEYKYADALAKKFEDSNSRNNEFFCYQEDQLIGYLGVCQFGNAPIEINGMVDPKYRRFGVFKELYQQVLTEMTRYRQPFLLSLCDANSLAGKTFLKNKQTSLYHMEYEMLYHTKNYKDITNTQSDILLEKATNLDMQEINQQNRIAEHSTMKADESNEIQFETIDPEEEEKRGVLIYLIKLKNTTIGKIHIAPMKSIGWIYGFLIKPEFRGLGYGKKALFEAIKQCKEQQIDDVILQVDSDNHIAFHLYQSVGFFITSAMEYYKQEL